MRHTAFYIPLSGIIAWSVLIIASCSPNPVLVTSISPPDTFATAIDDTPSIVTVIPTINTSHVAAPIANNINVSSPAIESIPPQYCVGATGSMCELVLFGRGLVSVGSILHDNCCIFNYPNGYKCYNGGESSVCRLEWDKAFRDLQFKWFATFSRLPDNISPVAARKADLPTKWETFATSRLTAPDYTRLEKTDVAFCRSKSFIEPPDKLAKQNYGTCGPHLSGTWQLWASGISAGCPKSFNMCGPFLMGDSHIRVTQTGANLFASGGDAINNSFTLRGQIVGNSVNFSVRGNGITPGIGNATTNYRGKLNGNRIEGSFTGSGWGWPIQKGKATWSGTYWVIISK